MRTSNPRRTASRPSAAAVAAVVALAAALAGAAHAANIYVPADHATIQAAIDAAVDGDSVVVAEGTYVERIDFSGKAITVRSTNPQDPDVVGATVIDGNQLGSVVTFNQNETSTSVLSGLTITNGLPIPGYNGGGIAAWQGVSPTISNCVICNNSAPKGGGVWCYANAAPTINKCIIRGNAATNSGGGIYCEVSSPVVTNTIISGNDGGAGGGGVMMYDRCNPQLTSDTISGNTGGSGGGLYVAWDSNPVLKNTIVALSVAGGGFCAQSPDYGHPIAPVITYCDVVGNTGGNYVNYPSPTGTNGNISVAPQFANAAANDFRLKSVGGRWDGSAWVIDTTTSPCIDAGDPASWFANEPSFNGGRINMGFDGDTIYASKTPIPAVVRWLPKQHVGALNTAPFVVVFNVPMFRASVESNFSISPTKAGALSWLGRKLTFTPTTPWVADKWYTVTINKAARSTMNVKMAAAFTWAFKTAASAAPPALTVAAAPSAAGVEIVTTLAAPAAVSVTICNLSGRPVAVLPDRDLPQGTSTLLWDGRSRAGTRTPAGQYLVRATGRTAGGAQTEALAAVQLR